MFSFISLLIVVSRDEDAGRGVGEGCLTVSKKGVLATRDKVKESIKVSIS